MRFFGVLIAPLALAAPLLQAKGKAIPGKWIVVMKDHYDGGVAASLKGGLTIDMLATPRHTYNLGNFKAYAMDASDDVINKIADLDDVSSGPINPTP